MSSSFSFDIDPHKVLGVSGEASLEEIRNAYRQKSKRYHPDTGGEDWTFRVVLQSYEMLSTARVVRATQRETPTSRPSAPSGPTPRQPDSESIHAGILDKGVPPGRLVAVEHLCVRYLWEQAAYLWLNQKGPDDERFLSCSLNLSWPDQSQAHAHETANERETTTIIADLSDIFDHLVVATSGMSSRSNVEDDRFSGWISYSNFDRSWKALKTLHEGLLARGLGLRQWSRDLFIPRAWE